MSIRVSPLDLLLDVQNPRFVILSSREQADIRKYLITYEDVCQLASAINEYGSLLPGERIVVLQENEKYVVVEGNRRTCSLQILLSRDLIPDGFAHRIPSTSAKILQNCNTIEVDVLPDRNAALELMTKRHIEGVKEWKPLAKKQFFAANFNDGNGQSISTLSRITGVREGVIREDIRDYKFFSAAYREYIASHPEFVREIVSLKTDPFWRIFKAKFRDPHGNTVSPKDYLHIDYDETLNTISSLPNDLFKQIVQLVFEQAIVHESINTRNTLSDVSGIRPLLEEVLTLGSENTSHDSTESPSSNDQAVVSDEPIHDIQHSTVGTDPSSHTDSAQNTIVPPATSNPVLPQTSQEESSANQRPSTATPVEDIHPGGPQPGGPSPRTFFETLSWYGKLNPAKTEHQGLLFAVNELFGFSTINCNRQKAYRVFPVATGMILRTVYEQALRLRLIQVGLWGAYVQTLNRKLPTLKSMEDFINLGANKPVVFPDQGMVIIYDRIIAATHRDFLNANIHYPGNINVTADSLESIAVGGMFALIQGIINMIN